MKKIICLLMLVIIVFTFSACVDTTVKGSVLSVTTEGDAQLDIMPQKLLEKVNIGDTVIVMIGKFKKEMPFVEDIITEDGKLQLVLDEEGWGIYVCMYNGNFCETYDIKPEARVKIRKNGLIKENNLTVDVSENGQEENDNTDLNNEVKGMQLLDFLKENITNQNTTDEIIDVFKQMCKTPIEEDLLLLEYGVYDFDEEDLFYFDLVRQYPDGDGEYYQLRVSLMFAPDKQNRKLNDTLWSDDTDEDFFDYIRKSSGYDYAKNHSFKSIDIRIDRT